MRYIIIQYTFSSKHACRLFNYYYLIIIIGNLVQQQIKEIGGRKVAFFSDSYFLLMVRSLLHQTPENFRKSKQWMNVLERFLVTYNMMIQYSRYAYGMCVAFYFIPLWIPNFNRIVAIAYALPRKTNTCLYLSTNSWGSLKMLRCLNPLQVRSSADNLHCPKLIYFVSV